jgi:hypothetical protein
MSQFWISLRFIKQTAMKITKMISVTLFFLSANLFAQTETSQEHLKGLTKASSAEIAKKQIMLDGETIPVYTIEGKRIRGQEMMTALMSGKYIPDFYVDKDKEIKAIAHRIATEEDKTLMKNAQGKMDEESTLLEKMLLSLP